VNELFNELLALPVLLLLPILLLLPELLFTINGVGAFTTELLPLLTEPKDIVPPPIAA
jgi:hypothetical protein